MPPVLTRLHELYAFTHANAGPTAPTEEAMAALSFVQQLDEAMNEILKTLSIRKGYENVLNSMPKEAATGLKARLESLGISSMPGLPMAKPKGEEPEVKEESAPVPPAVVTQISPDNAAAAPSPELAPTTLSFDEAAPVAAAAKSPVKELIKAVASPDKLGLDEMPPPMETDDNAGASAEIAADSVAASALAKLHAMKKKYNIQTDGARAEVAPATPKEEKVAAEESTSVAMVAASPRSGGVDAVKQEEEERPKVISPSLNVAALRTRLARLKKP